MSNLAYSSDSHMDGPQYLEGTHAPSGRIATVMGILGFVFMAGSGFLFFAAAGFSEQVNSDPGALVAVGGSGAVLVRWASLVDMFGYLLLAPLALYLHHRFRDDPYINLYTAAGLAYILVGAIGAIIFATAGPLLMGAYTSGTAAQRASIVTTFSTFYQIVVIGLWQTLEGIPGAVWLLGVGTILYRDKRRVLSLVPLALGVLFLLIAVGRLLGA